jgi:hypothetical protein
MAGAANIIVPKTAATKAASMLLVFTSLLVVSVENPPHF